MSDLTTLLDYVRVGNLAMAQHVAGGLDPSEWVHLGDLECVCKGDPLVTHCSCCQGDECDGLCGNCPVCGLATSNDGPITIHTVTGRSDHGPLYMGVVTGRVDGVEINPDDLDLPPSMTTFTDRGGRLVFGWEFSVCLTMEDEVETWLKNAFAGEVSLLLKHHQPYTLESIEVDIMGKEPADG